MAPDRTVHIVDDDAAFCRALERLLRSAGFATASYETSLALLDAATRRLTGCLLLDVWLPGMDGLELQGRLDGLGVRLPVIVMTGRGDIQTAVSAMKAGAIDFIEKPFDEAALLAAIETALARADHTSRDTAATAAAQRLAALSRREREVLDALAAGRPNKVIAYDLGISVRTVEVHRARMLGRLGTSRLAEAIRLSVMAGMAPGHAADQPPNNDGPRHVRPGRGLG
jgi:two-component system response regulator FixJ